MRSALFAILTGVVGLTTTAPLPAQGTTKKPPPVSQTLEIGGKTIDEWIADIPSLDKSKAENALRTVRLFPPELSHRAIPTLLAELRHHTPAYPIDTSVRVNLTIALGEIVGAQDSPDSKQVKDTVTLIARLLRDSQTIVRYRAAQALFHLGAEARDAVPELLVTLKDPATWEIRQASAIALATVAYDRKAGPPSTVMQALYATVKTDKSFQVRLAAIQALTTLGPPAGASNRQALDRALEYVATQDPEKTVQIWAHMAIMSVENKIDQMHIAAIGGMMESRDLTVRLQAIQALGTVGPEAKTQVSRLISALDDRDKTVAWWSCWTLGRIGKGAQAALPRLQDISASKEWPDAIRQLALGVIEAIEGKTTRDNTKTEKSK